MTSFFASTCSSIWAWIWMVSDCGNLRDLTIVTAVSTLLLFWQLIEWWKKFKRLNIEILNELTNLWELLSGHQWLVTSSARTKQKTLKVSIWHMSVSTTKQVLRHWLNRLLLLLTVVQLDTALWTFPAQTTTTILATDHLQVQILDHEHMGFTKNIEQIKLILHYSPGQKAITSCLQTKCHSKSVTVIQYCRHPRANSWVVSILNCMRVKVSLAYTGVVNALISHSNRSHRLEHIDP